MTAYSIKSGISIINRIENHKLSKCIVQIRINDDPQGTSIIREKKKEKIFLENFIAYRQFNVPSLIAYDYFNIKAIIFFYSNHLILGVLIRFCFYFLQSLPYSIHKASCQVLHLGQLKTTICIFFFNFSYTIRPNYVHK